MPAFGPAPADQESDFFQRPLDQRAGIDLSATKRTPPISHDSGASPPEYFYGRLRVFPDSRATAVPLRFVLIGQDQRRRQPPHRVKELNMKKTIFLFGDSTSLLLDVASALGQAGYAAEQTNEEADWIGEDEALEAFCDLHTCPSQRAVPGLGETANRTVHRRHRTFRPPRPLRPSRLARQRACRRA